MAALPRTKEIALQMGNEIGRRDFLALVLHLELTFGGWKMPPSI